MVYFFLLIERVQCRLQLCRTVWQKQGRMCCNLVTKFSDMLTCLLELNCANVCAALSCCQTCGQSIEENAACFQNYSFQSISLLSAICLHTCYQTFWDWSMEDSKDFLKMYWRTYDMVQSFYAVSENPRFLHCRFCNAIWRKKVAFENFSTVYMDKRTLRSKIWRARALETSWDFANYMDKWQQRKIFEKIGCNNTVYWWVFFTASEKTHSLKFCWPNLFKSACWHILNIHSLIKIDSSWLWLCSLVKLQPIWRKKHTIFSGDFWR